MNRDWRSLGGVWLVVACAGGTEATPPKPVATPVPPAAAIAPSPLGPRARPPIAAPKAVTETFHGVAVSDPYRWLEDASEPAVQKWSDEQNAFTRAALDALPDRAAIHARVGELMSGASAEYASLRARAGKLFALEKRPPRQQAFLVVMKSPDDVASERVIVDPNVLDASGQTSIDFFVPSQDGKRVAVSLSRGGSEDGTVHVYDVESGKETGDVIPRVNGGTAGGSVAWSGDGKRLYYTRYPHAGERPAADLAFFQQIWLHELGSSTERDRYAFGKDFPRVAEIYLETSPDGKSVLARVAHGDGGEFEHFLLNQRGEWQTLARLADNVKSAHFGLDGNVYLLSRLDAPRGKLLRLSPREPALDRAVVVVPESEAVIETFLATRTRLYVVDLVGGPSRVRSFDTRGKPAAAVPVLPISAVSDLEALDGEALLFRNESYSEPPAFYLYDAKTEKTRKTALAQTTPVSFADADVTLEKCKSKDGTEVPMTIVAAKGLKRDGSAPALLTGYGGYGRSLTPRFRAVSHVWVEQGGLSVVANLRGGGEFGEDWHLAGNLTKKQNVFDDFAACMTRLVELQLTRPAKLAITGGSNGGLLMGAMLVQHPQRFGAVVSRVGIYDMLRVENTPNGVFNVAEFGSVKDPQQFRALYAYSPYHHVADGTAYPATMLATGANDPRVDPYNSRKMAARLQAATSSGRPILLRTSKTTGHGQSSPLSDEIELSTDVFAFLFAELGERFVAHP